VSSSTKQALGVVISTVLLAGLAVPFALRVQPDDDVLAFLPGADADVRVFHQVQERFGGLDVAIIGLEAPDVLAPEFLARLKQATARLETLDGVASVLSLTNVEAFTPDPAGGIRVEYLVTQPRARVLLRDDVVGQLVDRDGRATVLYCFAAHGADPRAMARRARAVVDELFPGEPRATGGAPFIATYILDATQHDLRRLGPFAAVALALIAVAALRSVVGAALVLASTGIGIVLTLGLMGALGVRSNLLLSSMPIIVFALGSAYALHVVARRRAALGPTLLGGLATAAALASFVVMDIAPLRSFGLFTAIGLGVTLALAFTFVPAVLALLRPPDAPAAPLPGLPALAAFAARRRVAAFAICAALFAAALPLALRVDTRVDDTAFLAKGSPPERANALLADKLGGSTFLQIAVDADLGQPPALRALAELGDRVAVLPGVSSVTHIGQVLELTNEAVSGDRTLPATPAQAGVLFGFIQGKRGVRQLVSDDRAHALVQVKLASSRPEDNERTLAAVRALGAPQGGRAAVVARVAALCARAGVPLDAAALDARLARGGAPVPEDRVAAALAAYLASDEYTGDPVPAGAAQAAAALGPGPSAEALAALGLADAARPLADIWRRERAHAWARELGLAVPAGPRGEQLLGSVGDALLALDAPGDVAPLHVTVTGLPVLHQVLARSVARNQLLSLLLALLIVWAIAALRHRSPWTGLVTVGPSLLTIAILFAAMTVLGIRLDLGTSVLASLVVGAGTSYALHVLAGGVAVARAVATNALMVAAGFFVLTLGEARPLHNVGGLTAAAMILAAVATFLFVPIFARST
jgi:predicted RND superfamily exporter protein